jgi:uncharacterized membrane protein
MTKQTAVKIARVVLGVLIAALIIIVVASVMGYIHWMVAVVGVLGSSGVIVVVLTSLKQYKE